MIWLWMLACLGPSPSTEPAAMVEALHADFEAHYGLFPVKDVDWDAQLAEHGDLPLEASDEALHEALTGMMSPLNDNHVHLLVPLGGEVEFEDWTSGVLHDLIRDDFALEVTLALLDDVVQPHPKLAWGRSGDVGYIWIGTEGDPSLIQHLDDALDALPDVDSLILDVRSNGGGFDAQTRAFASRFVDGEPVYLRTRHRASAEPGDFEDWVDKTIAPPPRPVFDGPMVVLQHRFSVSAAEGLLLAMHQRDNTTFVGEVSSGAFGTVIWRDLPNGWSYSITVSDTRDPDGVSWEGIGLPPDIEARSTLDELRAGEDKALEAALEVLGVR